MLGASLLAIALAGPLGSAAAPADANAPLAGCSATRGGDDAVAYGCEGFGAIATIDRVEQVPIDAFFEGRSQAIVAGGGTELVRERARVGEREAEILRGSGGTEGGVTAIFRSSEGARIVICVASPADRCDRIVEALARVPWRAVAPGAVVVGEAELRLAGRRVAVPDGCNGHPGTGGGKIECPRQSVVVWAALADEEIVSRMSANFAKSVGEGFPQPPECGTCRASSDRVPCRIAGVDATCGRFVGTAPADREGASGGHLFRIVQMWGWVTLVGKPTFAACSALGPEPLPPPCAVVFSLR